MVNFSLNRYDKLYFKYNTNLLNPVKYLFICFKKKSFDLILILVFIIIKKTNYN